MAKAKDTAASDGATDPAPPVPPVPPTSPDWRDAEIERLRAELAAAKAPPPPTIIPTGPGRQPKVCKDSDRAQDGFKRFKVRAVNRPEVAPVATHILADFEDDAKAFYLKFVGLDKDADAKDPVRLFCKVLVD